MKVKVYDYILKDDLVEISKQELQKMLDDSYSAGIEDGKRNSHSYAFRDNDFTLPDWTVKNKAVS